RFPARYESLMAMQNAECRMKDGLGMADADKMDLRRRTKTFSLRIIRLYSALPTRVEAQVLGKQLLRSGTSVGANYREACRARSAAEFVSKMGIGLQELEESAYWLELLVESEIAPVGK